MTTAICEVIGCEAPAAFVRVEGITGKTEDFLCSRCYEKISGRRPDNSASYVRLDEYMPLFAVIEKTSLKTRIA